MSKKIRLFGASALTAALTLGLAGAAAAQGGAEVSEVVVTGSFIAGTPEDAALPVDVISAEDLQRQGAPSTLELIKSLTVSSGVIGDTNQFDTRAQGSEGSGSINLRGLGAQRTLVLMNGRRITQNPFGQGASGIVDTNTLPSAAVGRVEVLKDGAAAVYGSDAIAGVVNFITKTNLDGIEAGGSYSFIDGSDGDYTAYVNWGSQFDGGNILLSFGWQHRSELRTTERDWAQQPYFNSPEGGWSAGSPVAPYAPLFNPSPGVFAPLAGFSLDVGCAPLGGVIQPGALPACLFNYTPYDNLTELEDRWQLYGEVNYDLTDNARAHLEVLYAETSVPEWKTSPGYLALQTPTTATNPALGVAASGLLFGYFVPASNPGLALYRTQNPGAIPAAAVGVHIPGVRYRPFGYGGNPIFDNGPSEGERSYEALRVSGGIRGDFGSSLGYDLALTYSREKAYRTGYDTIVSRFQLALRGLGGAGCNPATGTPGVGSCMYFNPFSNSTQVNRITGQTNPNYSAAVANNPELVRWFFQKLETWQETDLWVADAVLTGETGIELGGGPLAWAAGVQFRRNSFESDYNDLADQTVTPCVDTPFNGSTTCAVQGGPFMFLGVGTPASLSGDVKAVFGELSVPLADTLQIQVAARYEDYGGAVGSTFDPKISARWQIADWLALRGSAGSTFRGPPQTSLAPGFGTGFQFIAGSFRAIDFFGNPNLEPESANTYSVGVILDFPAFRATIDWWRYEFENPMVAEPAEAIVSTMFPGGTSTVNCGVAAFAGLQARFTFQGACSPATIARVRSVTVNGPPVETSGIDVLANLDIGQFASGDLRAGLSATYTFEYLVGAFNVEGVTVFPAYDAAGYLNYLRSATSLPEYKVQTYLEWGTEKTNLRWTVNIIDSYIDQRPSILAPNLVNGGFQPNGAKIADTIVHELDYRVFLPWDVTFTASIDNVFDQDPPFARLDLNYDPFTGSAYGRVYKISLQKKF